MRDIADLFFVFGGINYSRYLTWFDVFLTTIKVSHPGATQLLEKGAISVTCSKSQCGAGGAGLTGILENYGAYQ